MIGIIIIWIACGMFAAGYLMPMDNTKTHIKLYVTIGYFLLLGLTAWPFMFGVIVKEYLNKE